MKTNVKTKLEDGGSADDTTQEPGEQSDVPVQEDKRQESNKKELDEYSDGVKRRIAKLTKKMREAERREEACNALCKSVLEEQEKLKTRLSKIDTSMCQRWRVELNLVWRQQLLN